MAYRTYVRTTGKNSIQILGNNESYRPLFGELKRQGIKIDDDYCFSGKIKEIQPIVDILEQYIWDIDKQAKLYNEDIFNLRPNEKTVIKDFTFRMRDLKEYGYIFVTANLIDYLKDNLDMKYDIKNKKYIYKIKDGKEVWLEAY